MTRQRPDRAHARTPFGGRVELWKYRTPQAVTAADISAGGVFLRTRDEIREGSYVTIRIPLPGERPFSALCRVVRQQSGARQRNRGLALAFVDIAPRNRELIASYVAGRGLSQVAA